MFLKYTGLLFLAYLIGSLPFGYWIGLMRGKNILEQGSRSTGTTNVIRVVGKWWGILTLLLDIGKGYLAVFTASMMIATPLSVVLAGILAIIGHSKSVFIGFKGGKSAATGMGIILFLNWKAFLIVGLLVIIVRQISGYQSLATIIGALMMPLALYLYQDAFEYILLTMIGGLWILIKHIPNIKRLIKGEELRIARKKGKG